jgi:hypothetical protein
MYVGVTVGLDGSPKDKPIAMLQNMYRPDGEQILQVLAPPQVK